MEHKLVDNPLQLYNVDESAVPLHPKLLNIITKKGSKKVWILGRKNK